MANLNHPNIEKSAVKRGEYVGYEPNGNRWRVRKDGTGSWEAVPAANHPARFCGSRISAPTLSAIAHTLASRQPARVVEPF